MDWISCISEIRKAQEKNQLVVFAGAGVSKNSNLPTWWELVKNIADRIDYKKCTSCEDRTESCPTSECKKQYAFTQDEFLRIPEYYYEKDAITGHREYYGLIQETLRSNNKSNPVDDEIFNLLPHHIITTNYDTLLESSNNLNARLYTVVSEDKELLSKASDRYIIKMHGDINHPQTIVLKETDYINYEQNHTLISTFIRSLLINHTFLFLGYSLNDYNLNLIIGWINYFQKYHSVTDRPHNFLLVSKSPIEYEVQRLASKNIYVIDLSSLPKDLAEKVAAPTTPLGPTGKSLYVFLSCLTHPDILQNYIPLADILAEKYQVLSSYHRIAGQDLIRIQPLGHTDFKGTELVLYEDEWYQQISSLIEDGNPILVDVFQRAGLTAVQSIHGKKRTEIPESNISNDICFQLYLDNNYVGLSTEVENCADADKRLYYHHLLGRGVEVAEQDAMQDFSSIHADDYIAILLHKMRSRIATLTITDRQEAKTKELEQLFDCVPVKYRKAVGYLRMLFESTAKNAFQMEKYLTKQEEKYASRSSTLYMEHSFTQIWNLQPYAYDYYFFSKENGIPLDYFSDPKEYLSYYLRALLCSYSPVSSENATSSFGISTDRRHYPIDRIDLDMLVKYTDSKSLKSWIEKYSIQSLELERDINIALKYKNMCESISCVETDYWVRHHWIDQLYNLARIASLAKLDSNDRIEIIKATESMFHIMTQKAPQTGEDLFEIVNFIITNFDVDGADSVKSDLIDRILGKEVYPSILERHSHLFYNTIKQLAPFSRDETKERLNKDIDSIESTSKKLKLIFLFRDVISINQYVSFLSANIDVMDSECAFHLLIEKVLPASGETFARFFETIKSEAEKREDNPGLRSFPDWLTISIEQCLILKILGFDYDLTELEPYAQYSDHLQFMLHPDAFDYSMVDFNHYMWQNLIYSKQYSDYFIKHKKEILSDGLESIFNMQLETREQQKIVYGFLLEKDSLRQYGDKRD